jgi:hypothetical protein
MDSASQSKMIPLETVIQMYGEWGEANNELRIANEELKRELDVIKKTPAEKRNTFLSKHLEIAEKSIIKCGDDLEKKIRENIKLKEKNEGQEPKKSSSFPLKFPGPETKKPFVKEHPVISLGGLGLASYNLSQLFGGKKKKYTKKRRSTKKKRSTKKRRSNKKKSIKKKYTIKR